MVSHPRNYFPVHVPSDTLRPGSGPHPRKYFLVHVESDLASIPANSSGASPNFGGCRGAGLLWGVLSRAQIVAIMDMRSKQFSCSSNSDSNVTVSQTAAGSEIGGETFLSEITTSEPESPKSSIAALQKDECLASFLDGTEF